MTAKTITVRIRECKSNGRTWQHSACTSDPEVALERCVTKHFGAKAFFSLDTRIANLGHYGQIFRGARRPGNAASAITGHVRVDFREAR